MKEGDVANLRVKVARIDGTQALLEITSMQGPYSLRVPITELSLRAQEEWKSYSFLLATTALESCTLLECPRCKALVRDAAGHWNWHAGTDEVIVALANKGAPS